VRSYEEFLRMELAWFDRWLRDDRSVDLGAPVKILHDGRRR